MLAKPRSMALRLAVHTLEAGGVVACPTEAVWGLSCDPDNEDAVHRILALKRRQMAKGLIIVAASESQVGFLLADLAPELRQRLSQSWPGPNTWLIRHKKRVPSWICGQHESVAVRVSSHPQVKALCEAWGGPLVSTSANPAGARAPVAAFQVRRYFKEQLDYILPGAVGSDARPSTIRDLLSDELIRA